MNLSHLSLYAPIPQNGQTLKKLSVFDHFVGLAVKELTPIFSLHAN